MSLIDSIAGILHPAPPPDPATRNALERIAEVVDPRLKTASHFESRLAAPVQHALGYCEGLVAGLPGPVDIGRQAFGKDPLIHALFATADDIGHMLGSSQSVSDYLDDPASRSSEHFYALLAARRQEKRQLGLAMQGEVIRAEVPQTVVYFSDHLLVEPHGELEATLARLRADGFDSLLKSFKSHLEALRLERESISADCSAERAHVAVLRGHAGDGEITISTRRLAELDAHLREVAESLMPDQVETALAAYLQAPEMALRLDRVTLRVDRLGILADPGLVDSPDVARLSFPELCARDQRRHLVMLARIDCEEARQAIESTRDQQRRFMLI